MSPHPRRYISLMEISPSSPLPMQNPCWWLLINWTLFPLELNRRPCFILICLLQGIQLTQSVLPDSSTVDTEFQNGLNVYISSDARRNSFPLVIYFVLYLLILTRIVLEFVGVHRREVFGLILCIAAASRRVQNTCTVVNLFTCFEVHVSNASELYLMREESSPSRCLAGVWLWLGNLAHRTCLLHNL